MKLHSSRTVDMAQGPIFSGMVRFALPLAASSILQLLFNAADVIVIGQFGSANSLAAVGADGLLVGFFANVLLNLSIGATVLAARHLGAGERGKVRGVVGTSMLLAFITGVIFMIAMFIAGKPFLRLLDTPEAIMPLALQYLYFYLPGLPGVALYNFSAAVLRAKGDTLRPFFFLLASGALNVVLNLFFVIVCKMDVAGVALATTISQYVATALMLVCLARESGEFRFEWRELRFDGEALRGVLKIGAPAAFQCTVFYISNFVIQAAVNSFGPVTMAGNAVAANIEMFVWVCMSGFEQAGMTYVSRNYGARDFGRVDRSNRISLLCTAVIGLVLGSVVAVFAAELARIYTPDSAAISQAVTRIRFVCGTYLICGLMDGIAGNIRGLGYSMLPSVVTIFGACILRIVWIMTFFQIPQHHTLNNLYVIYPGSWAVTALVLAAGYVYVRRRVGRG